MYQIGDFIVYGIHGLCKIENIGPSPFDPKESRLFFTLHPVYAAEASMIFTPVDNDTVVKRSPMTKEQANALIKVMPTIPALVVEREKDRRDIYRQALRTTDPMDLVALLRTVMERRFDRSRINKRLTDADTDFEKKAQDNLYSELSLVLDISVAQADEIVCAAITPVGQAEEV